MQTNALISLIRKEAPDYSTELAREIINEVQKMVYRQRPVGAMRMYDSSTGKDHLITATDGVYEYTVNTAGGYSHDADFVTDVYIEDVNSPMSVTTIPSNESSAAKFIFRENPGTSQYYVRAYRKPSEVATVNTALEIPGGFHLSHVYDGVMGFIEQQKSGRSERWERWLVVSLPDLVAKLASSNRGGSGDVPYRGY